MSNPTSEGLVFKPGCYFDAGFGFDFNAKRIIDFANTLGAEIVMSDIEDIDALIYDIDEAESYLNAKTIIPENYYWGFYEGDFGVWLNDEDGDC